jgi:hypothetical protein
MTNPRRPSPSTERSAPLERAARRRPGPGGYVRDGNAGTLLTSRPSEISPPGNCGERSEGGRRG